MAEYTFTRAQYIEQYNNTNGMELHRKYYSQFVTHAVCSAVLRTIDKAAIMRSIDPHFNDIPLGLWDTLHQPIMQTCRKLPWMKGYSLGDTVCIAKEAARQIKENSHGYNF